MDPFTDSSVPLIDSRHMLTLLVHGSKPCIIYVYSPTCPHCIHGYPEYLKAVEALKDHKDQYYRFDGSSAAHLELFKEIVGTAIKYYPMIIGISKDGRIVEFNDGPVSSTNMEIFMKALYKT